jgi:hypothetical protein
VTIAQPSTWENPDPHPLRPDTHHEHFGLSSPTQLDAQPPDVLEIDVGRAFSAVSNRFTPEFRRHLELFKWKLDLRRFRTEFQFWEARGHASVRD